MDVHLREGTVGRGGERDERRTASLVRPQRRPLSVLGAAGVFLFFFQSQFPDSNNKEEELKRLMSTQQDNGAERKPSLLKRSAAAAQRSPGVHLEPPSPVGPVRSLTINRQPNVRPPFQTPAFTSRPRLFDQFLINSPVRPPGSDELRRLRRYLKWLLRQKRSKFGHPKAVKGSQTQIRT